MPAPTSLDACGRPRLDGLLSAAAGLSRTWPRCRRSAPAGTEARGRRELLHAAPGDPTALSWLVASAALLTTEDRQALLAESATRRRLAREARLLRRELMLLQTLRAVPVPLRQFATPMTVN